MFALPYSGVTQIKFVSANDPYSGEDPQFSFFYIVKGRAKVSLEPTRSQSPSAQNNLHDKVAQLGVACLQPNERKPKIKLNESQMKSKLKPNERKAFPYYNIPGGFRITTVSLSRYTFSLVLK